MRLATLLLVLLSVPAAMGETYYVHADGSGDFETIQDAVYAASWEGGDVIVLTEGTFSGEGNVDVLCIGKPITIRSSSGNPTDCIIDCFPGYTPYEIAGFVCEMDETRDTIIEGISIKRATAGGVRCADGASPSIRDCIFELSAEHAIYMISGCAPSIQSCRFMHNTGWGVEVRYDCTPVISSCVFEDNLESGVYSVESSPHILDCLFARNTAGNGAGIRTLAGSPIIEKSVFVGNHATGSGGGILITAGNNPQVLDCTLYGNSAPDGGGIHLGNSGLTLRNSVVSFSSLGVGISTNMPELLQISCSDIYGNLYGDWVGGIAEYLGHDGNIWLDPFFCHPDQDDFTLRDDSPCAPFMPPNMECDLIGALGVGCSGTSTIPDDYGPTQAASWGEIKSRFR